jgi:uncharacterized membrane protein YcaP (DUF421 family)
MRREGETMDSGPAFLAAIAVRTALVFAFLMIALRVTGKRQTGELNARDLLVVLMMANAVQNAMTQGSGRLTVAWTSSGTLILLSWLLVNVMSRSPAARSWLIGVPTVLAQDGRLIRRSMRQQGVSEDDVMAAVRDQGLPDIGGAKLVVLEVDGTLSVIPRDEARQR